MEIRTHNLSVYETMLQPTEPHWPGRELTTLRGRVMSGQAALNVRDGIMRGRLISGNLHSSWEAQKAFLWFPFILLSGHCLGLALTACPPFPFHTEPPPAPCLQGATEGLVTVGWPSALCLRGREPAFSPLLLALFSGVAQQGSAFLENSSELCSAKARFPKL